MNKIIIDNPENVRLGRYIRVTHSSNKINFYENQKNKLDSFCKDYKINNYIDYTDMNASGMDEQRKAFQQMLNDLKDNKINMLLAVNLGTLTRNYNYAFEKLAGKEFKNERIILTEKNYEITDKIRELNNKEKQKIIKKMFKPDFGDTVHFDFEDVSDYCEYGYYTKNDKEYEKLSERRKKFYTEMGDFFDKFIREDLEKRTLNEIKIKSKDKVVNENLQSNYTEDEDMEM